MQAATLRRVIGAAVVVLALAQTAPVAAETLNLRCTVLHNFYERRGETVTSAAQQAGQMTITVDTESGAFVSGRTNARAMITAEEIVAMGSDDPRMNSLWLINRSTGEFRGFTSGVTNVNTVFLTAEGQCRTADGATQF